MENHMDTTPIITIIVPVYNRADLVLRTLDSIAAQSYRPLKLIVVDNNSTDATPQKVREWMDSHRADDFHISLLHEPQSGAAAARNCGLANCDTPWVMHFDSDDEMLPEHLSRIAKEIHARKEADLIYFDMAQIDEDGWTTPKSVNDTNLLRGHIFHCTFSTQRWVARTSLVREAGGWNTQCTIWDDLELGIRLALKASAPHKLHGNPSLLVHHSDDSLTGNSYAERAGRFEKTLDIIEQDLHSQTNPLPLLWLECRRMILAAAYMREGLKKESRALRTCILDRHPLTTCMKLHAVYAVHRICGYGASWLATALFKEKREKNGKLTPAAKAM